MCGIVGYVGPQNATDVVIEGLRRLEYRGYDSAGLSVRRPEGHVTLKRSGKLKNLEDALEATPLAGAHAIGHTRWATHGPPTDRNAHPHVTEDTRVALIHNGIIENHQALRERLNGAGHVFTSDTDSEVLVHLIEEAYDGDLSDAVRAALRQVEGAYAVVVSHADHDELVVARMTSPLVLGYGEGETFVASDVPAILKHTRRVSYLQDGQVATLRPAGIQATDLEGHPQELEIDTIDWDLEAAEKGGWPHFMLKEIYEQPQVLVNTLSDRLSQSTGDANLNLTLDPSAIDRIVIVAAGTASYAGEVGRTLLERWARIPTTVEVASEFRYANPIVDARTLVVAVSQSGETIDTLEAVREGIRHGARSLAILNSKGSSISREVDDIIDIHAGPEIGVASTKAYVAMVTVFAMLALHFGRARGALSLEEGQDRVAELKRLPNLVADALEGRPAIAAAARSLAEARSVLYLGRGVHVASAKEGALKLKEISYVHAEAFPTGEMKHGPIALIDAAVPTVAVATDGPLTGKTASNLQEIKARGGRVFAIATRGADGLDGAADVRLDVPPVEDALAPVVVAVPLQLLAYEASVALGRDVDQPRNLAKSVTVE